jgi:hypothetical protein
MIDEAHQNMQTGDSKRVTDALIKARDSAIRLHRAYNIQMAVSRDGKVVEISPFDLQTEDEKAANTSPSE